MLSFLLASAFGAVLRYLMENSKRASAITALLLINVVGSFLAGFGVGLESHLSSALIAFAGTFTTFSGLIASTRSLRSKSPLHAFAYGHGSIALSVLAAWIGLSLGG